MLLVSCGARDVPRTIKCPPRGTGTSERERIPMSNIQLEPVPLGELFDDALEFASTAHRSQARKGTTIPYVSHLLSVAALVLEDGGDETEAIAGLLHDVVEDQSGAPRLEEIRVKFGAAVAHIVDACSDTEQTPKPPWSSRNEDYIAHLADEDPAELRVPLADKLHNCRSLLTDYRSFGDDLWLRFNAGRDDQIWYYNQLVTTYRPSTSGRLLDEFERVVEELTSETDTTTSRI